jgi:hypothetical protein
MNLNIFAVTVIGQLGFGPTADMRAELMAFLASCWPLIEENPCPSFWANAFEEAIAPCHA